MSFYLQCPKLTFCHKDRIMKQPRNFGSLIQLVLILMQRVFAFGFSGTLIQLVDKIFSYSESLERCQSMIWEISVDLSVWVIPLKCLDYSSTL